MGDEATFLFAMPSVLEGAGRILDVGATMDSYNDSPTPEEADAWAIERDWRAVGSEMWRAIRRIDEEARAK